MKWCVRGLIVFSVLDWWSLLAINTFVDQSPPLLFAFPALLMSIALVTIAMVAWQEVRLNGKILAVVPIATRLGFPPKAVALLLGELGLLKSLWPGRTRHRGHSYHKTMTALIVMMLVLIAVEAVVVHLAISHWIKWPLLVVSVYGVLLMLGFWFSLKRNPHTMDADGVVIRYSTRLELCVSRDQIAQVGKSMPGEGGSIECKDSVLRVPVLSTVNTFVEFSEPVEAHDLHKGTFRIDRAEFYVDEPERFRRQLLG